MITLAYPKQAAVLEVVNLGCFFWHAEIFKFVVMIVYSGNNFGHPYAENFVKVSRYKCVYQSK